MNPLFIGNIFQSVVDIIKELVPDKDKQLELITQVKQQEIEMTKVLVSQSTVPWVDATVKLLYAISNLAKEHWRPLVSAYLFLHGISHPELIQQLHNLGFGGDTAITSIFGAFPGWMYSRHIDKSKTQNYSDQ
jgi:hypothetical protein